MTTKGQRRRSKRLPKALVREMAKCVMTLGFCLFFVLGGAGFTLSHYCCGHCRAHHCGTEWAQGNKAGAIILANDNLSEPGQIDGNENGTQIAKKCGCCFVRHFEIDTTEVGQPQALPAAHEIVLFCTNTPSDTEFSVAHSETDATEHLTSPPILYTGGKTVLQQVCRWLI